MSCGVVMTWSGRWTCNHEVAGSMHSQLFLSSCSHTCIFVIKIPKFLPSPITACLLVDVHTCVTGCNSNTGAKVCCVQLWAQGHLPADAKPDVDIEITLVSWGTGSNVTTKLCNPAGEVCSLTVSVSFSSQ